MPLSHLESYLEARSPSAIRSKLPLKALGDPGPILSDQKDADGSLLPTSQDTEIAKLRQLLHEAVEALRPFAALTPSPLYPSDGSESEGYDIVTTGPMAYIMLYPKPLKAQNDPLYQCYESCDRQASQNHWSQARYHVCWLVL
jgi:hypothetical protein